MIDALVPLEAAVARFLSPRSRRFKEEFQSWDEQLRTIFTGHYTGLPVKKEILTHDLLLLLKRSAAHYAAAAELLKLAYSFYGLGVQDRDELELEFQELDPNAEKPLLDRSYFHSLLLPPCVLANQQFPAVFGADKAKVL